MTLFAAIFFLVVVPLFALTILAHCAGRRDEYDSRWKGLK